MPVTVARRQEPKDGDFRGKQLPALFVWRKSSGKRLKISQDSWVTPTLIQVLWVPPKAQQNTTKVRASFTHAIEACIESALQNGRHPAWVHASDTDPTAADQGSYFYKFAKLYDAPDILKTEDFELKLPAFDEKQTSDSFDCFLLSLEIREQRRKTAAGYAAFGGVESNITINAPALPFLAIQFYPSVIAAGPSSGSAAGGTLVTIMGRQLPDGTLFAIDGAPMTEVTRIDDETFTAVTPAHLAGGPYPLTATTPAGQSAALLNAFTYV